MSFGSLADGEAEAAESGFAFGCAIQRRRQRTDRVAEPSAGHGLVTNDDGPTRMTPDDDRPDIAVTCGNPHDAGRGRTHPH